jgi:predicted acylesterase/phospholipase RssA
VSRLVGGAQPHEVGVLTGPRDRAPHARLDQHDGSQGPTPEPFQGDRFQILALDGGGAKALFTAHVLAHIEEDLGVTITHHFDLIAGTSAGGIVALGLGAMPRSLS